LVVDPTDANIADADNLRDWYGADAEHTIYLRRMLRGELSLAEWYAAKERR